MSYSNRTNDYTGRIADSSKVSPVDSQGGRYLQLMMLMAEKLVDDYSATDATSRANAVVVALSAVGIATKQDLETIGGDSFASKIMASLTQADQVAVIAALP